jgi:hypothetical protein
MPWDWPVEVNCLEANAYCRWLSAGLKIPNLRLSTEDEYALGIISFNLNIITFFLIGLYFYFYCLSSCCICLTLQRLILWLEDQ